MDFDGGDDASSAANMRARALRLGADLDIAAIAHGLRVRLVLPLAPG